MEYLSEQFTILCNVFYSTLNLVLIDLPCVRDLTFLCSASTNSVGAASISGHTTVLQLVATLSK